MNNYLINLSEEDLNRPIYRIYKPKHFLELLDCQKNTLIKPSKWDDPFEAFAFTVGGTTQDGKTVHYDFLKQLYGQCWSLCEESVKLWEEYSPYKTGIKVKTSILKLLTSLKNTSNGIGDTWIGKVNYEHGYDFLIKLMNSLSDNYEDMKSIAECMLLKDGAKYSFEDEIRLIHFSSNPRSKINYLKNEDMHTHKLNFKEVIDEVVFDPRMDNHLVRELNSDIEKAGLAEYIVKSKLPLNYFLI